MVAEREAEVLEAFKTGASVKEVNEALFLKHGKRMALKRIYAIREVVRNTTKAPEVAE